MHHRKLNKILKQYRCEACYITNPSNVRYLSNFVGTNGALFMTKKHNLLFTDFRYFLVAKSTLPKQFTVIDSGVGFPAQWKKLLKKYRIKQIGIEGTTITYASYQRLKKLSAHVHFVDVGRPVSELRMRKESIELKYIQQAQNITDKIFTILKRTIKAGMSEQSISWLIESSAHTLGADGISFPPIVGINEHSASPHHHNTDRKLKKGDLILLDFGVIYKGYCSDMTRMLFTKTPDVKQKQIYELVLKAQETAISKITAGMRGKEADAIARDIITKAGFGGRFGHSLGHGVGLDIHELPNLAASYNGVLPQKSVVTVEPGIYLDGEFGVRLEDMIIVGTNGATNMTRSPKRIQDCILI